MPVLLIFFLTFSILGGQTFSVGAQPFPTGYGASLTGNVDDKGVDIDGDGLFDYLQISVEVNVTYPWILHMVEVDRLLGPPIYIVDRNATVAPIIQVRQSAIVYPKSGLQLVNISLYGPTIYSSGLKTPANPEKIYRITLSETYPEYSPPYGFHWDTNVIDTLSDIPLSREYSYTEFDPPVTDVEAKFVVYPDGRVVIGGGLSSTPATSPLVGMLSLKDLVKHGNVSLTRTGLRTMISQNDTVLFPPEYASEFPLNSTTMSMLETYSAGSFNTRTNCTVIFPPHVTSKVPFNSTDASLSVTYADGLFTTEIDCSTIVPTILLPPDFEVPPESEQLLDFVGFLLNSTDISIVGEYQSGELSGSVTISMLPGFALGNLDMAFQGNQTDFSVSGDTRVLYGSFYGLELTEENLDMILLQLNSIQGTGPGSLYEMTNGVLECTKLNATKTPITNPSGCEVNFEVDIHGDILEAFTKAILSPYLSPQVPSEERERLQALMHSALNTTLCSVQTTSYELGYTHATRQASMEFTFVDNVQSLVDGVLPLVPQIHYSIPITLPDILNKTFSCTKTAAVQMTYTKADGKIAFETTAVAENLDQVRDEVTQLIVETLQSATLVPLEIMPTEIRLLVESLLNTTYCSLESYESSLTYENGRQDVRQTYTIQDDLNAELNHIKDTYLQYMLGLYSLFHTPVPWQHSFINQTEIDIRSLRASYNFTEPSMKGNIEGLGLWPPIDSINSTRFQLRRFFELASEMTPYGLLGKGEKFKITIEGGSNLTHSVMLFAPTTVPEPDETASDRRRMVWYNQTPNSIMDTMFDIRVKSGVGEFEIAHPEFVNDATPYIANATENIGAVIEITGISKPARLYVANLTEPPEGVDPPPGTYKVFGKYVFIQCMETDVNVNATIRMDYTPEQLSAMGLNEETLKIHCWNATLGAWIPIETHVNTSEHYAWATISHFSIWALMAQPSAVLIWSQPLFWILLLAAVLVIAAATYALVRKRR